MKRVSIGASAKAKLELLLHWLQTHCYHTGSQWWTLSRYPNGDFCLLFYDNASDLIAKITCGPTTFEIEYNENYRGR